MRSILIRLATLLLFAATTQASRLPDEFDAYMFVDGEVSVSEVGRVTAYRLDTQIDPQVQALVDRVVARWLFEPQRIDGKEVAFDSTMRVTLHGQAKDGELIVRVEEVAFTGKNVVKQGESFDRSIRATHMQPPRFPREALTARLQGRTMIALRVDRAGQVIDATVSHTDLVGTARSDKALSRARGVFERSALSALKQWRFELSDHAIPEGQADTSVLIPVTYTVNDSMGRDGWVEPGRWSVVTLGPKQRIGWLGQGEIAATIGSNGAGSTLPIRLMTQPDGTPL